MQHGNLQIMNSCSSLLLIGRFSFLKTYLFYVLIEEQGMPVYDLRKIWACCSLNDVHIQFHLCFKQRRRDAKFFSLRFCTFAVQFFLFQRLVADTQSQ